jgi:hypothetical protein
VSRESSGNFPWQPTRPYSLLNLRPRSTLNPTPDTLNPNLEGSFGTIYKSVYLGERVAVKRILKDQSNSKSLSQRMREVLLEVTLKTKQSTLSPEIQ